MHTAASHKQPFRADPEEFILFIVAYLNLLLARWEAGDRGLPTRTNPVSYSSLRTQMVSDSTLLWLLYHGHVEHLRRPSAALLPSRSTACGSR